MAIQIQQSTILLYRNQKIKKTFLIFVKKA